MKTLFYKAGGIVQQFFPFDFLVKVTGQSFVSAFYHAVSNEPAPHLKHICKVRSTVQFEKDLDFLLQHYQALDITEVIHHLHSGEAITKNSFLLSFDDGLREFHDVAAPILQRKGVPAVCFLNSAFIDNHDMFYRHKASLIVDKLQQTVSNTQTAELTNWFSHRNIAVEQQQQYVLSITYAQKLELDELATMIGINVKDYAKDQQPYLTSEQINRLISQGFAFGAHSIDHPLYADLPAKSQIHQTVQSINTVSKNFNLDYKVFSFPFTDTGVSKAFFTAVFGSNYPLVDVCFGSAGLKNDECNNTIQRIPVEKDNFTLQEVLFGEYLSYMVKALCNKNTIKRA